MNGVTLILAPHTDDEVIGAGGLIGRYREEGRDVVVFGFSAANESLPSDYPQDTTLFEQVRACKRLGCGPAQIMCADYPVRRFSECRQAILEEMLALGQELNPQTVVVPAACDCHQDHEVVHQEAIRAFKESSSILGYEPIKNGVAGAFRPALYVRMNPEDMERKIKALECYQSQLVKRPEIVDMVQHLGWVRGYQCGADYAEAYEVIRWIL